MQEGDLDGVLAKGTKISGVLQFERSVRIDGQFEGKVESKGKLILGRSADVDAELQVGELEVQGRLKGKVRATGRVLIRNGGEVDADVTAGKLAIEDGATFRGHCEMPQRGPGVAAASSGSGGPELKKPTKTGLGASPPPPRSRPGPSA